MNSTRSKPGYSGSVDNELSKMCDLILYNDEVNTFEFVIDTLIEVCGHDPDQAHQCTLIAHLKGKCAVRNGSFSELRPFWQEITNRGLTVEIE